MVPAPTARARAVGFVTQHKVWSIVGALVIVSLIGNAASALTGSGDEHAVSTVAASSTESATPPENAPLVDVGDFVTEADCTAAQKSLAKHRDEAKAITRKATAKGAYEAEAKVERFGFDGQTDVQSDELASQLAQVFAAAIERARTDGEVAEDSAVQSAVSGCKLADLHEQVRASANEADRAVANVIRLASSRPWYPKGFGAWPAEPNVALKFVDDPDCDYLGCFQIRVITNTYCDTLYMALATENAAGEKVGFTNDILTGLSPGDRGLMTFLITDDSVQGGDISEVTCY